MNVRNTISPAVLTAAVAMLQEYVPELSPTNFVAALKEYGNNDGIPEKPMTKQECAKLLGVSIMTVNRYIKDGLLKANKIGNRLVRIETQSVRNLLATKEGCL